MKIRDNMWTWVLFENNEMQIYSQRLNGLYYIFYSTPSTDSNSKIRWINDEFINIILLWDDSKNKEYPKCYYLLENYLREAYIIDILNKKIILKDFERRDFKGSSPVYNKKKGINYGIIDTYIRFVNQEEKKLSFYSLSKGLFIRSQSFDEIELYRNGYILNKKTLFNNIGDVREDITGYVKETKVENVYYNEQKGNCILLLDHVDKLFLVLESDEEDVLIFEAIYNEKNYKYNIGSQELKIFNAPKDYEDVPDNWTAADASCAYEGYSRLELGLD